MPGMRRPCAGTRWNCAACCRRLPQKQVPAKLASQLQVMASHERARRSTSLWQGWMQSMRLVVNNLMRPIAIPFAGGVSAALFLFSMLTPTLTIRAADARTDVPAYHWLYTQGTIIDTPPFSFQGEEVEVLLTIDKNGQITDYSCAEGKVSRQVHGQHRQQPAVFELRAAHDVRAAVLRQDSRHVQEGR